MQMAPMADEENMTGEIIDRCVFGDRLGQLIAILGKAAKAAQHCDNPRNRTAEVRGSISPRLRQPS